MIQIRVGRFARQLGVHRNTARNWIKSGELEAKPVAGKRYAIQRDELVRFLLSKGVEPETAEQIANDGTKTPPLKEKTQPKTPARKKEVPMSDKTVGSVMVVGGGIASIQASLDLAESGYYVYLVERSPGIGGRMAQLDKTFPTNDCAM